MAIRAMFVPYGDVTHEMEQIDSEMAALREMIAATPGALPYVRRPSPLGLEYVLMTMSRDPSGPDYWAGVIENYRLRLRDIAVVDRGLRVQMAGGEIFAGIAEPIAREYRAVAARYTAAGEGIVAGGTPSERWFHYSELALCRISLDKMQAALDTLYTTKQQLGI